MKQLNLWLLANHLVEHFLIGVWHRKWLQLLQSGLAGGSFQELSIWKYAWKIADFGQWLAIITLAN